DAVDGVIPASVAYPAHRSRLPRAATLARGPTLVLRLGYPGRDRRRRRWQERGHPQGAVVSDVRRLAAGRAHADRLLARWASPAPRARRLAGDPRRSDRRLGAPPGARAGGGWSRQRLRERRGLRPDG